MGAPEGIKHEGRLLVFKLGGTQDLPPQTREVMADAAPAMPEGVTEADLATGKVLFHNFCHVCHGVGAVGGGVLPDLRYSSSAVHENWDAIVLDGMLTERGMGGFSDWLTEEQAAQIHAYVIQRAQERPALSGGSADGAGGNGAGEDGAGGE
jgi:quinohemoprotein ethanol dehydrogenase